MSTLTAPCEFLTLKKEDFNNVLKETIKARWDEIRESIKKFNYFDYWDEITISECCILSKLKTYEPNQVILGDGVGKSSQAMVYFVIEGKCSIIEHLFVIEKVKKGIKTYELYDPVRPRVVTESIDVETCVRIDEKPEIITISDFTFLESYDDDDEMGVAQDENNNNKQEDDREMSIRSESSNENFINNLHEPPAELENIDNEKEASIRTAYSNDSVCDNRDSNGEKHKESLEASTKSPYPTIEEIRKIGLSEKTSTMPTSQRKTKFSPSEELPEHVKIRFMQVGILGEKSTFTNNNTLDHRRIVALTPVKCILIPNYWLTQHNSGNVWTRVSHYIAWRMPTHEQVFRKYVAHKKWIEFKKKLISDVLKNKKFVNNTTIHDVPYSIRVMNEEQ